MKLATAVPIAFWHASCVFNAGLPTAAAGGLLAPSASATTSATRLPLHAGGATIRHVAVGPVRSRLLLHATALRTLRCTSLASGIVVHCAKLSRARRTAAA